MRRRGIVKLGYMVLLTLVLSACATPHFQPVSKTTVEPEFSLNHFIMDDGYRLPLSVFEPSTTPKAIMIALHGFNDYSRAFESFCSHLSQSDILCLAYDQRGFGSTEYVGYWPQPGRLQQDLKQVVQLVKSKHGDRPIFIAGESMGGAVILSALEENTLFWQNHIEGVVLFAPAVWARETQPWYQRLALWFAVHIAPGWKPTGESLEIVATDNIEALRQMGRDPLVIKETRIDTIYGLTNLMDKALDAANEQTANTLVLYGEKDEVIPKEPTCIMLDRLTQSSANVGLKLYADGYHMLTRDLQAVNVFKDVVSWVNGSVISLSGEQEKAAFCSR